MWPAVSALPRSMSGSSCRGYVGYGYAPHLQPPRRDRRDVDGAAGRPIRRVEDLTADKAVAFSSSRRSHGATTVSTTASALAT